MAEIDSTLLNQYFTYKDGHLFWKISRQGHAKAGDKVGSFHGEYIKTTIHGKAIYLHQVIFCMFHGYIPSMVDHNDGNKLNNRIENLRPCSIAQNGHNAKLSKTNTSGYKNVKWHKKAKKWMVSLKFNNKEIYIGIFKDVEIADLVATEARDKYFGKFARHK